MLLRKTLDEERTAHGEEPTVIELGAAIDFKRRIKRTSALAVAIATGAAALAFLSFLLMLRPLICR